MATEDFVYIPSSARGEAFRLQDKFRTVTIGFQPYIPFSQAYRMGAGVYGGGTGGHPGGIGRKGYATWAPEEAPDEEQSELMGSYEWDVRRKTYFGQGSGRLSAMSVNPNRGEKALAAASNLAGQGKEDVLGQQLSKILDTMDETDMDYTRRSSRAHQEIMLGTLEDMAEAMAGDTKFTDRSSMFNVERDQISRGGMEQEMGKGFDVFLEKSRSFGDFLEDATGENLDKMDILNLEVSRAVAKEGGSKLLTNMDTTGMNRAEALERWKTHLRGLITKMNLDLKTRYLENKKLIDKEVGELARIKQLREQYDTPKQAEMRGLDTEGKLYESTMREMLDRMASDLYLGAVKKIPNTKHLWSAPITPTTVGLTLFWPSWSSTNIPQIGWEDGFTWSLSAIGGDIAMGYALWMKNQGNISPLQYTALIQSAAVESADEAVSTLSRIEALYSTQGVMAVGRIMDNIGLGVRMVPASQSLISTEVSVELRKQLMDYFQGGQMRSELRVWYEQLMEESNRLTTMWMDALPENTSGTATLSSEYVLGDLLGNPRKKYLGVWSEKLQETWKGAGEGSKGDIGYNFSIAPFVEQRRAGTSGFG